MTTPYPPEDLRVLALLDGIRAPAVRFRFHQIAPHLEAHHIELERWCIPELVWPMPASAPLRYAIISTRFAVTALLKTPGLLAARAADATIVSRQVVQGLPYLERFVPQPWFLDVDDALWEARPLGGIAARDAARTARGIVAGNPTIAAWYSKYNSNVVVIPTSVDTARYSLRPAPSGDKFTVGWIGSATNIPFLQALDEPLGEFLASHPSAELLVISDARPSFKRLPGAQVRFRAWSPATEVADIQSMNVGLMPIADTPLARGKSAAKLLTYAACGVPVIASPVGVNVDILREADIGWGASSPREWLNALNSCFGEPNQAKEKGLRGRELVDSKYSAAKAASQWAQFLYANTVRSAPPR